MRRISKILIPPALSPLLKNANVKKGTFGSNPSGWFFAEKGIPRSEIAFCDFGAQERGGEDFHHTMTREAFSWNQL
jgi:hypothetical protein